MVKLEWTPRLEAAFRKLHTRTQEGTLREAAAARAEAEVITGTTAASWSKEELKTVKAVDAVLEAKETPVCVDLDLVRRVSALLLKHSGSSNNMSSREGSIQQALFNDEEEDYIHAMIRGSSVYVPKPAPKQRSPELEQLMEGFRAQVAEQEYQRMVSSIDPTASSSIANHLRQDMKDMKDIKAHAIGIVNVLYTGAAVFTAVFMISAHFTDDLGKRVLLALLAFVLIVACEAYLYSRHASAGDGGAYRKKKAAKLPEDVVIATSAFGSGKKHKTL
ncbi:hypothetical protein EDD11_008743 [Mortierella claussenii]|nr:hypothetical protein EDD11_008743 [Mortierella claussenii]